MAIAHEVPRFDGWLSRLMTTDFCPWANRFVYWLKEPIGWFVLATAASVIVGLYLSPIGWTLAASMTAIMVVGMAWPLFAVHVTKCELRPEQACVHEGDECRMVFAVRNRVPIPIWGLAVEGYLDCDADNTAPTVGLACVPPLCVSDFGIKVKPALRGHYPIQTPNVACSFPFGIWTARRKISSTKPLTVWPKVYPIQGSCSLVGPANSETGEGNRGGRSGDFVGVRAYRRGDSAKHINWVASAKVDSLVVTERSGPQCVELDVFVDTHHQSSRDRLADRVRVAASVLVNLHQCGVPMQVTIGSRCLQLTQAAKGRRLILDALADIPADGTGRQVKLAAGAKQAVQQKRRAQGKKASIEFTTDSMGREVARLNDPLGGRRSGGRWIEKPIGDHNILSEHIRDFWLEVRDADVAA